MTESADAGRIRIGPGDLERYERCPQYFAWKKAGRRGTKLVSRALTRSRAVTDIIIAGHQVEEPPSAQTLKELLSSRRWQFVPINTEERHELLDALQTYAEIAEELGGTLIEREDRFLERKSVRRPITIYSHEPLLLRHFHNGNMARIEARQITTSQYREIASEFDFQIAFRTHLRHLVVDASFPNNTIQLCEVNLSEGTHACTVRTPEMLSESAASIFRFEDMIRAKRQFEPRLNYLCGTCEYMPSCRAIPSMESPW